MVYGALGNRSGTETVRIIACIDVKGDAAIKSVRFDGLRKVGEPAELAAKYVALGVDEIILHDTTASLYGTPINFELVQKVSSVIDCPLIVSGGIKSVDDCYRLLEAGADRIAANTVLYEEPSLVSDISYVFGSQFLVSTIEYRAPDEGTIQLFCQYGRELIQSDVTNYLMNLQNCGVGEFIFRSIERDGTNTGIDRGILDKLPNQLTRPIVLLGGAKQEDLSFQDDKLSGLAIGSGLHFGKISIGSA